ncbi:MAG: hypothetical protein HDR88_14155 [Bacteroides sp.]|nr:hypothetical protein [Bacteroides sp.]
MKTIKIDIKRCDIDEELSKITAYTGAKSISGGGNEDFDRVATVEEDSAMLNRYWHNAAGILTEHLKEFVVSANTIGGEMVFTLEVSGAYDESLTPSVKEGMFAFVAASMAKNWFLLTYPEKAPEWEAETSRLLRETAIKLYHRRKPIRTKSRD